MRFLLLISLFIPAFAVAEENYDEKDALVVKEEFLLKDSEKLMEEIFESEKNIKYLLKSQGIEPTRLNWSQIALMCSNLQRFDDKIQNKCKYENAKLLHLYVEEKAFCKKYVEKAYSLNRLGDAEAKNYLMIDSGGNKSNITLVETGRTIGAIRDIQESELLSCMKDHGWVNPDNWQAGRM